MFTDFSMSAYDYRNLFGSLSLVVASLLVLLGVSLYLSRFVTRPAEEMIKREKQFISDFNLHNMEE